MGFNWPTKDVEPLSTTTPHLGDREAKEDRLELERIELMNKFFEGVPTETLKRLIQIVQPLTLSPQDTTTTTS